MFTKSGRKLVRIPIPQKNDVPSSKVDNKQNNHVNGHINSMLDNLVSRGCSVSAFSPKPIAKETKSSILPVSKQNKSTEPDILSQILAAQNCLSTKKKKSKPKLVDIRKNNGRTISSVSKEPANKNNQTQIDRLTEQVLSAFKAKAKAKAKNTHIASTADVKQPQNLGLGEESPSLDTPTSKPPPSLDTPTSELPPSLDTPTSEPPPSPDTATSKPPPSPDTPTSELLSVGEIEQLAKINTRRIINGTEYVPFTPPLNAVKRDRIIQVGETESKITLETAVQCDLTEDESSSESSQSNWVNEIIGEYEFLEDGNMHECQICGEVCPSYSSNLKHSLIHKESSLLCFRCGRLFPNTSKLLAHEDKSHAQDKQLKIKKALRCPKLNCLKAFHSKRQLFDHIDKQHCSRVTEQRCSKCQRSFQSPLQLLCHMHRRNCWR